MPFSRLIDKLKQAGTHLSNIQSPDENDPVMLPNENLTGQGLINLAKAAMEIQPDREDYPVVTEAKTIDGVNIPETRLNPVIGSVKKVPVQKQADVMNYADDALGVVKNKKVIPEIEDSFESIMQWAADNKGPNIQDVTKQVQKTSRDLWQQTRDNTNRDEKLQKIKDFLKLTK